MKWKWNVPMDTDVSRERVRSKLARLVRCFSCLSAEPVTIALTSDFLLALNSVKERGSHGALRSQLLLGLVSAQLC